MSYFLSFMGFFFNVGFVLMTMTKSTLVLRMCITQDGMLLPASHVYVGSEIVQGTDTI